MSTALLVAVLVLIATAALVAGFLLGRRSTPSVVQASHTVPKVADPAVPTPKPVEPAAATPLPRTLANDRPALSAITSWGYQLQKLKLDAAAASAFDLLVVDYSRDGSAEKALTRAEVQRLQTKPDGSRRLVVAYISIGEAESYRAYWQKDWAHHKPDWLLGENPDWEENYAVCFWDEGWQRLMFGTSDAYLDRIMAAGFDGVYLDKADVFEDLETHYRKVARSRPDIAHDMVEFVARLSAYAKKRQPGFLVIMQNAETLLKSRDLLAAIDGVAKEELMFGLDAPEKRNNRDDLNEARTCLDLARRAGKAVMVVEYLGAPRKIAEAASTIRSLGYTLYIAPKDRELDRLGTPVIEV